VDPPEDRHMWISCVRLTEHIISNNRIENEKKSILGAKRWERGEGCNGEKVWEKAGGRAERE